MAKKYEVIVDMVTLRLYLQKQIISLKQAI